MSEIILQGCIPARNCLTDFEKDHANKAFKNKMETLVFTSQKSIHFSNHIYTKHNVLSGWKVALICARNSNYSFLG